MSTAPRIRLGNRRSLGRGEPVFWDLSTTLSGHAMIVGSSGTGKTTQLRHIADTILRYNDTRVHVIDVHGDIGGADNPARYIYGRSAEGPGTPSFGVNPLEIGAHPDHGGPEKRISALLPLFDDTFGPRQRALLRRLCLAAYARFGITDHPATWAAAARSRAMPSLRTLIDEAHAGLDGSLDTTTTAATPLRQAYEKALGDLKAGLAATAAGNDVDLDRLRVAAAEQHNAWLQALEHTPAQPPVAADRTRLLAIIDRLEPLVARPHFCNPGPRPVDKTGWRIHDLTRVGESERRIVAGVILENLMLGARQRGERPRITDFIVLDEAAFFVSKDPEHIVNRMVREIRKFGFGLIFSSQSLEHFSKDILDNVAMTMILGLASSDIAQTERRLGLKGRIAAIAAQKTAIVQTRVTGQAASDTSWVDIDLPPVRATTPAVVTAPALRIVGGQDAS